MINKKIILIPATFLVSVMSSSMTIKENNYTSNYVKITFFLDKGTFRSTKSNVRTLDVRRTLTWSDVKSLAPKATDMIYTNHSFKNWQYDDNGQLVDIVDTYRFNQDVVLTAKFVDAFVDITFECSDAEYKLPFTTARIPCGTIWGDVINTYKPKVIDVTVDPTNTFNYFYYLDGATEHEIKDDYVISGDMSDNQKKFIAKFSTTTTQNFSTDSWTTFIKACNKGLNYISTTSEGSGGYKSAYESTSEGKQANTFVGLKRNIKIAGNNFEVKVIGENEDYQEYDSGTGKVSKPATLTFEFTEVLCDGKSYSYPYTSKLPNNAYESSALRGCLYKGGDLFGCLPNDVKNNILPVYKKTYVGNGGSLASFIITKEYMFALSAKEIGFTAERPICTSKKFTPLDECLIPNEGSKHGMYSYYYQHNEYVSKKKNMEYHLRSPEIDSSVGSWYIDSDIGNPEMPLDVVKGIGVAPAFAIGKGE